MSAGVTAELEISSLRSRFTEQQRTINELQVQLDDLVKAKEEHEEMLLIKFVQILNSKKAKIRDQQRLLARANVDTKIGETEYSS